MKTVELDKCKCKICKNCTEVKDKVFGRRISCKFAPGKEFLIDFCDEMLLEGCQHFSLNSKSLKKE